MVWWVVTVERDLMGPYLIESKAQEIKDGLDIGSVVRSTKAERRLEAVRELRHQDVEEKGISAGHRNYKHRSET